MVTTNELPNPEGAAGPGGVQPSPRDEPQRPQRAGWWLPAALVLLVLAYLAAAVPGPWFPSVAPRQWPAAEFQLVRGEGRLVGDEWVITGGDASGIAIVSVATDIRSADYRAIAWQVAGLADAADAQLLWRNEFQPTRLHAVPLATANGRVLPKTLAGDANWTGRIGGVALSIRGRFDRPVRIRGVVATPMGAAQVLRDRAAEWFAFEPWSASSINALDGGADVQPLPLPALLAAAVLVAALAWLAYAVRRGSAAALPGAVAALFVTAWVLLDARWTANLVRQVAVTAAQYAGKDVHERHLAAEDAALYAFAAKARALIPAGAGRVFMVADADYVRGRGAWHLYPRNVFFDPVRNALPPRAELRAGDYVVAFQRRGVQFNAAEGRLRWDGVEPIGAEALLVEPGGAVFRIK